MDTSLRCSETLCFAEALIPVGCRQRKNSDYLSNCESR